MHLVLHWKWIVCVLRGKPHSDVSGGRFALGVAGLVLVTLLAAAPLLTPAQTAPRSELLKSPSGNQQTDLGGTEEGVESSDAETIRGFMTLEEVASQSGVPVSEILRASRVTAGHGAIRAGRSLVESSRIGYVEVETRRRTEGVCSINSAGPTLRGV